MIVLIIFVGGSPGGYSYPMRNNICIEWKAQKKDILYINWGIVGYNGDPDTTGPRKKDKLSINWNIYKFGTISDGVPV